MLDVTIRFSLTPNEVFPLEQVKTAEDLLKKMLYDRITDNNILSVNVYLYDRLTDEEKEEKVRLLGEENKLLQSVFDTLTVELVDVP